MATNKVQSNKSQLDEMFSKPLTKLGVDFLSLEVCANKKILDLEALKKLKPRFCSIPWLPDSNDKADEVNNIPAILLADKLKSQGHTVLLHLAANDLNRNQIIKLLEKAKTVGLKSVLALQGDFSGGKPVEFPYAKDLVTFINENYANNFCIGVAGYPDKHPAAESPEDDLRRLKEKVDCGAEFIITQAVFEYATLQSFHGNCRKLNINVPIVPGIFVVHSQDCIKMISSICKIPIPEDILSFIDQNKHNPNAIECFGIEKAAKIIKQIFESRHFPGVHIFTLNRLDVMQKLYEKLGLI